MQALKEDREKGALRKLEPAERGGKVAGLVLAAGSSSRMGQPKQLLPDRGKTLLEQVLDEVLNSNLDRVVLVLGHRAQEIRKALGKRLRLPKLSVVENRRYQNGMSSSMIAGLRTVEEGYDHVMVILADMPHVSSRLIDFFLARYKASGLPMGAVTVRGRRSHPVVFSRRLYPEMLALRGDVGARALFEKYSHQVCLIEPERPYNDRDIDTVSDYLDYRKSLQEPPPWPEE